jgi:aryl-alcohol dehydrogenase-like predicted oxidoreductase
VRRECEASLRRLRTDRIDLYQIHWPNDEERLQEGWEEIGRLIQEGKVRYGGVSNFDIAQLERVERVRSVSSLQSRYSMIHREIEDGAIGYCSARGIGVLAYSPMASGLLSGQFDRSRLTAGDWRLSASEFQQPNLSTTLQLVDGLRGVADRLGKTVSQLAIAWVLRRPEVTSAIVGVRRLSQMQETARGAGWTIAPEIADEVERLLSIHRKMIPPEAARFR